jgi:hypothetical protein
MRIFMPLEMEVLAVARSAVRTELFHWKKAAEALFSDSGFVAAGKRRDFCRLPCQAG